VCELRVSEVTNYYFRGLTSHPTELQVPPVGLIALAEEPWSVRLTLLEFSWILSLSLNAILGHFKKATLDFFYTLPNASFLSFLLVDAI
jgi:hypothetical protein